MRIIFIEAAPRDVTTIDLSDITTVPVTFTATPYGEHVVEFASDLDEWTMRRVQMRLLATDVEQQIQDKAWAAFQANNDFLAIASPTTAQAVAQVKLLTRECNGILKMIFGIYDSTSGM